MNDRQLLELARTVCTPRQLQAVQLHLEGYGRRRAARILGISPQAVAHRLDGAARRIERAKETP